jgi:chemotaxis protein methyltransferase CheR
VQDTECIEFLRWALPRLQLRWAGYRKVRRQVCKRVSRRIRELELDGVEAYRARLDTDPGEWAALDDLTQITISRFFRDRDVFTYLCETVLPELHTRLAPQAICIWSAGCAGGEEAYTLAIAAQELGITVRILGTDRDEHQLARARAARYTGGCVKDLPARWRASAFDEVGDELVLRRELFGNVELRKQDIRREMPAGPFHLILCRYLAFTYFDAELQREIAKGLLRRIAPDGYVALGKHESWPADVSGLDEACRGLPVYRRSPGSTRR